MDNREQALCCELAAPIFEIYNVLSEIEIRKIHENILSKECEEYIEVILCNLEKTAAKWRKSLNGK